MKNCSRHPLPAAAALGRLEACEPRRLRPGSPTAPVPILHPRRPPEPPCADLLAYCRRKNTILYHRGWRTPMKALATTTTTTRSRTRHLGPIQRKASAVSATMTATMATAVTEPQQQQAQPLRRGLWHPRRQHQRPGVTPSQQQQQQQQCRQRRDPLNTRAANAARRQVPRRTVGRLLQLGKHQRNMPEVGAVDSQVDCGRPRRKRLHRRCRLMKVASLP